MLVGRGKWWRGIGGRLGLVFGREWWGLWGKERLISVERSEKSGFYELVRRREKVRKRVEMRN